MKYENYKNILTYTVFNNYPDYAIKQILDKLVEKEIIVNDGRISKDKIKSGILDVSMYTDNKQKLRTVISAKEKEVIKAIEEVDYEKAYRYSVIFDYSGLKNETIEKLIENKQINIFTHDININDYVSFIAKNPTTIINEDKIEFKFSFVYDSKVEEKKVSVKYVVEAILFTDINILEIRFDQINGLFKSTGDFYKDIVVSIKGWLQTFLQIKISNIDLKPMVRKIVDTYNAEEYNGNEQNAEVIPIKRDMCMKSGSKVVLDMNANKDMVAPILGELKGLIRNNIELFKKSPGIHELLLNFINEIEETSDLPKVRLLWKAKGILIGVTHEYKESDYSLLQYYGELGDSEAMDYVTRYLIENRTDGEE